MSLILGIQPPYLFIWHLYVLRNLTDIHIIPSFTHVVYLDLSGNKLTDDSLLPLSEMKQLLVLVVNKNLLETAQAISSLPRLEVSIFFFCLSSSNGINHSFFFFQLLGLRQNRISNCLVNYQQKLKYLDLSCKCCRHWKVFKCENRDLWSSEQLKWSHKVIILLETCLLSDNNHQTIVTSLMSSQQLPALRDLELRGNGLRSTIGLAFPFLVSLFLVNQKIISATKTKMNIYFVFRQKMRLKR